MNTATETRTARCDRCATEKPYYLVTVQRDGVALCSTCVNEINERLRAERKAQLAARPKCECCNRRVGTWIMRGAEPVRVCGPCKKRILTNRGRQTASWGIVGLLGAPPVTREQILELAAN